MNRRMVLKAGFAFAATLFVQRMGLWPAESKEEGRIVKVTKTNDEWKKLLTPDQYHVLREEGTERAFTNHYHENHQAGTYQCVACALPQPPNASSMVTIFRLGNSFAYFAATALSIGR